MGLVDSGFAGMRPWTRNECARLLGETGEHLNDGTGGSEAEKIYRMLATEFRSELENAGGYDHARAQVESVYARMTQVSRQALTDGNHFGQTAKPVVEPHAERTVDVQRQRRADQHVPHQSRLAV
jgi:hypothetical protein